MTTLKVWIDRCLHLPPFLRDFHDQKRIFKAIQAEDPGYSVSWVSGHQFVIDRFLPWMAEHGYTLQRTRKKSDDPYRVVQETLEKLSQREIEVMKEMFNRGKCQ